MAVLVNGRRRPLLKSLPLFARPPAGGGGRRGTFGQGIVRSLFQLKSGVGA